MRRMFVCLPRTAADTANVCLCAAAGERLPSALRCRQSIRRCVRAAAAGPNPKPLFANTSAPSASSGNGTLHGPKAHRTAVLRLPWRIASRNGVGTGPPSPNPSKSAPLGLSVRLRAFGLHRLVPTRARRRVEARRGIAHVPAAECRLCAAAAAVPPPPCAVRRVRLPPSLPPPCARRALC